MFGNGHSFFIFVNMKAASVNEVKNELSAVPHKELLAMCMRLAKYKKENKELLTYLLFEADDEAAYIRNVKEEIDVQFLDLNKSSMFLAKKTIRKVLRTTNKFIRYSGIKRTEVELLIHYCKKIKATGLLKQDSVALHNLYQRQLQRIKKSMASLHEDLQYDYNEELKTLF